ncbi:MAG: hypothetical protein P1U88_03800 [Thalassobaculaceae bacterium]|nr:hypothetical protein [Thalassobaculaceae bacterium]
MSIRSASLSVVCLAAMIMVSSPLVAEGRPEAITLTADNLSAGAIQDGVYKRAKPLDWFRYGTASYLNRNLLRHTAVLYGYDRSKIEDVISSKEIARLVLDGKIGLAYQDGDSYRVLAVESPFEASAEVWRALEPGSENPHLFVAIVNQLGELGADKSLISFDLPLRDKASQ